VLGRYEGRGTTDAPTSLINGYARTILSSDLVPNDWNPNEMTPEEEDQLEYEIKRFGFLVPLIVRDHPDGGAIYQIIDGENRFTVGIARFGMDEFPCWVVEATDDEAMQLTPILNELHGTPNQDKLGILLRDLMDRGVPEQELRVTMPFGRERFDELIGEMTVDWDALNRKREAMEDTAERWVERVYRMPAAAAEVVDQAIDKARQEANVENDWQGLEYVAAEFMAQ